MTKLHLLGSLSESALQRGDGDENLRNTNEDVRSGNDPDVDRSWVEETASVLTGGWYVVVARGQETIRYLRTRHSVAWSIDRSVQHVERRRK